MRLLRPREFAQRLRGAARVKPESVEEYLRSHPGEWGALAAADPHDAADILEELDPETATALLLGLDRPTAAGLLDEMRPERGASLLDGVGGGEVAEIIGTMDADMAADLLGEMDPERREDLLERLEPEVSRELNALLQHAPDSAGGLMITDVAVISSGITTGEAIERLRQLHDRIEDLSYVYVVDHRRHLMGVVSFRDLVFARPGVALDDTMSRRPITVRPDTDREEVAELVTRYGLFGLPVVDHAGVLIGMVTHEAVVEAVQAEATEDFAAAMGAGPEETVFTPILRSVMMRLPWMVVNLVMALFVALVIERQSQVIDNVGPILAALMPMVALVGGNAGAQSLAVVIRGLATNDLSPSRVTGVVLKQLAIGASNAVPIGLLAMIIGAVLGGGMRFGLTMGLATVANLTIGALAGTSIPLFLRRLGFDPALASNIFLTLVTDVVGFGGFLLVASLLL